MTPRSFTYNYGSLCDAIVTGCGVSRAVDSRALDMGETHPVVRQYRALWDTGANCSAVSSRVADELGLDVVAYSENFTASGVALMPRHFVNIVLPNGMELSNLFVLRCGIEGADVLLGMDVISRCDFAITNVQGATTFSFQMPSVSVVDFKEHK